MNTTRQTVMAGAIRTRREHRAAQDKAIGPAYGAFLFEPRWDKPIVRGRCAWFGRKEIGVAEIAR
jgi:hypothetical protein